MCKSGYALYGNGLTCAPVCGDGKTKVGECRCSDTSDCLYKHSSCAKNGYCVCRAGYTEGNGGLIVCQVQSRYYVVHDFE
ncbi:hypothetical protein EB796_009828 [Bugula neritina]|uniref:Uncharacterized protein n=1 Tax=Bugula neritina TaxID=10212 RepID=A0A7J7K120_BUGNE|nr:hypothetical protein EB796_009828 [Bugula neritina]